MVTEIMKETVKALLIDPENEEVKEVELTRGDGGSLLRELYRVIGCNLVDVMHDAIVLNGKVRDEDVWIDDEALLKNPGHFWRIEGSPYEFAAGRAVILGYDPRDGESVAHQLAPADVDELRRNVRFAHLEDML